MTNVKSITLTAVILSVICAIFAFVFFYEHSPVPLTRDEAITEETTEPKEDMMELVVYLQNKEEALYNDCGITYPQTIEVPQTTAVVDASLEYLFANELARYGTYESVTILDGVAKIVISHDGDPQGYTIAALSSCESRHLYKVIEDTLTQYESIESIELFSPTSKIEF